MKILLRNLAALLTVILCAGYAAAQKMNTETQIFNPNFKTLQIRHAFNEFFPPVVTLGGNDFVTVSFDEMVPDMNYYRYRLVHCNSDWQPSSLVESEYVDGFNEGYIENYKYSSATFANYVHYSFAVPNKDLVLTKSGNYLVQVYPEEDPEDIVLQCRFCMSEDMLKIGSDITSRTDIDYNKEHQQLTVRLAMKTPHIRNWYHDIEVFVSQNSREDTTVKLENPSLVESDAIVFSHLRPLIFPAGNEFRRFECVATNYPGMGIENIIHYDPYYHIELFVDGLRSNIPYAYDQTQFGRFKVRQSGAIDSESDADYVVVHFALEAPHYQDGEIYVDGEFTQHRYAPSNRMRYNPSTGLYELDLLMKMGSYNYQYLFVPKGSERGYTKPIEGDHHETVNEYFTRVYYRPSGARYDRLLGFGVSYSGR